MRPQSTPGLVRRLSLVLVAFLLGVLTVAAGPGPVAAEPAAGAALTVTPSTDLNATDTVTVSGRGFAKNTPLLVMETIALPNTGIPVAHSGRTRVTTDAQGGFSTTLSVRRSFARIDCGKTRCFVTTIPARARGADRSQIRSTPISFRTGTAPTLVVTPHTDLRAGTQVTVAGSGFAKGRALQVAQTVARPIAGRPVLHADPVTVTPDARGRFTTTLKVYPKIHDVNCLKVPCFIAAYPADPAAVAQRNDAWAPIAFDPSDTTMLAVDRPQILQSETAKIDITGAQPLDRYLIKVDGPDGLSAQPFVVADEHGNATVLLMSDFDQGLGSYRVHFTNERSGNVTEIGFTVGTNALFNPAEDSGTVTPEKLAVPTVQIQPLPANPADSGPTWNWVLIGILIAVTLVIFGVVGWFARD
ncbi:neocarzinostatin apoprotein domain-containing protein [Gordonia sp. PP30]|uniref:neocarzinostatin apoprotein domain-containing protein n=1 Tax=Gordonia sp. PP30 TaxID=2935861 RepID=UPI001FFF2B30|nr:neocarzinostatin apoprotein domain-containing protein [Gordonia sp. PP30]UQE74264.1 neocarzinostatin apoprotein domain-containing protein [Gordonia sp. PP30]